MFHRQPLLVSGYDRDGEFAQIEQFVCLLYGYCTSSNANQARLKLFKKAKKDLEMLPSIRVALKLRLWGANYQAKILLQAHQEHIQISSLHTSAWTEDKIFPGSCVDNTSCYPRCLSLAGDLCMQIFFFFFFFFFFWDKVEDRRRVGTGEVVLEGWKMRELVEGYRWWPYHLGEIMTGDLS